MKKTKNKILVGVALAVVLASAFLGLTFSKYNTVVTGRGETEVAQWNFKVNNETEEFATIKLADTYDESTLINGKIAPGTSGSFVDFKDETNKPTNLKFSYEGQELDEIADFEQFFTDTIDADDTNKVRTLTVNWEWLYETGSANEIAANDEIDTEDGLNALDYSFDVVVTGTQVVPTK